jgi:hypothetical protein
MIKNPHYTQFDKLQQELLVMFGESGIQGLFQNIQYDLAGVCKEAEYFNMTVDVYVSLPAGAPALDALKTFCNFKDSINAAHLEKGQTLRTEENESGDANPFTFAVHNLSQPAAAQLGKSNPCYALVLLSSFAAENEGVFLQTLDEYPFLLVAGPPAAASAVSNLVGNHYLVYQYIDLEQLSSRSFREIWSENSNDKHAVLQSLSVLKQIDKLGRTAKLISDQEERNIRAKKAISQQGINAQTRNRGESINDTLQKIKAFAQQQLSSFEKGIQQNAELYFRPINGTFVKEMELMLDNLDDLQRDRKSKNDELSIPTEFLSELKTSIRKAISSKAEGDLKGLTDILMMFVSETEQILTRDGVNLAKPSVRYLTPSAIDGILSGTADPGKRYSGQAQRKGVYEYFMAARKYQMLILMVASVFGLNVLRANPTVTLPLSIVMIGFGAFSTWKTVVRERTESDEKEINKARETLLGDLKDIAGDFQRYWPKMLIDHFKEQVNSVLQEIEVQARSIAQKQTLQGEEDRKKQQRSLQNLEQLERRIEAMARSKANWERNLAKATADMKGSFIQSNRSERRS